MRSLPQLWPFPLGKIGDYAFKNQLALDVHGDCMVGGWNRGSTIARRKAE
jgi:hypothetical protein